MLNLVSVLRLVKTSNTSLNSKEGVIKIMHKSVSHITRMAPICVWHSQFNLLS